MPDVALNRPLTVAAQFLDANGQPQTAGASATLTVKDPSGTQVYTGAAGLVGGDGLWGAKVPGSAHVAAGVYTWTLTSVSDGAGDGTLGGLYSAGQVSPDQLTLWDVLRAVTVALRDGREGKATVLSDSSGTITLTDPYYKGWGSANNWVGAQVLLPYVVTPTDTSPLRVSAYDPTTGNFTLPNGPTSAPTAPARYLLQGQRGFRHDQKLDAILRAIRDARPRLKVSNEFSLTGTLFSYNYAIPDSWTHVRAVYLRNSMSPWAGDWEEVAPIHWEVRPDRRILQLDYALTSLVQIRLDGRFQPPPPQFLGSYVDAPAEFVISRALEYLCAESPHADDRAALQYYAAKAEAAEPAIAPHPNEVSLG